MKRLIISIALLTSFNSFASGGDEVRNGGGLIEQYFTYAMKILPQAIDRCLTSVNCAREESQKEILKKIKKSHKEEMAAGVLKFYSQPPRPDFFFINGVERLAFTGDYVGSPIYYNTKMLYQVQDTRIGLGQAIQSLIHELGHHHGAIDHDSLELLGSEVRHLTDTILTELPYMASWKKSPFKYNAISVLAIGRENIGNNNDGNLNLIFKNTSVDIGDKFQSVLSKCDATEKAPIKYRSMQFTNLHWDFKSDDVTSSVKFLSGNINLYCKNKFSRAHRKNFKFDLKIKVSTDGNYTYESSELLSEPQLIFTENLKLLRER